MIEVNGQKLSTEEEMAIINVKKAKNLGPRLDELYNEALAKGMKLHSCDEILAVLADERASGEGLARLWR
jgi:predicted peroxiredoxin